MKRTAIPSPTILDAYAVVRTGDVIMPTLECDGFGTLRAAQRHANNLNDEYAREQARLAKLSTDPFERPLARGLYTDEDAR